MNDALMEALRIGYRMRQIQKECFKFGGMTKANVAKSKKLEAEFDKALEQIIKEATV